MKLRFVLPTLFIMLPFTVQAQNTSSAAQAENIVKSPVCVLETVPSADHYKSLKRIKVAKGIYGGYEEIKPKLANAARKYGADVVIDYEQRQRFGFWPWRIVRPVLTGTAVKWNTPFDCAALGGKEIH
ncbi:hypothetical protein [Acinetobacter nosocomialis]|uniref:hypothetical protein n=1 Tax=Acinetobacter nosocomialis TaxID=106654 RepID=UPI001250C5A8|nr:hypothetical protein [Acinetobacter nosocomialis]